MSKLACQGALFVLSWAAAFAADFDVHIVAYPRESLRGLPVEIVAIFRNVSGHPITVAKGRHGFEINLSLRRADGRPIPRSEKEIGLGSWVAGYELEIIPPDWTHEEIGGLLTYNEPGDYVLQYILSSSGPYEQVDGKVVDAWSGEVKSEEMRIRVLQPVGYELKAHEAREALLFRGNQASQDDWMRFYGQFPTSIYTAYCLWSDGTTWTKPEMGAEKDFHWNEELRMSLSRCPSCLQTERKVLLGIIQPWERLYRDFPNFPLRARLLYGLSRCYFHIAEPQRAAPLLNELLTKFRDDEYGKKAVAYKELLELHGLWQK